MKNRRLKTKDRGTKNRKKKAVYLIVTEGKNKTEKTYFVKFIGRDKQYNIHFVNAGYNTDAESLLKRITNEWDKQELDSDLGDKGFIVLDIDNDEFKANKIRELIADNNNEAIQFVVSNPSFEIWFLEHFKYTAKFFADGKAVIAELEKYIDNYDKGTDYYSMLEPKTKDALKNVTKLTDTYNGRMWPSVDCNPRTDVNELVEILIDEHVGNGSSGNIMKRIERQT